jgi:hypothetical protein
MKVAPPEVPTPWMAGGGNAKAMAPGMVASRLVSSALIAVYCSSGCLRSAQFLSVMKKKAL